jgi:alkylated DNA repair dioxygenase AlkB
MDETVDDTRSKTSCYDQTTMSRKKKCCCPTPNITRIDDDQKGLHVDIHRGLFASSNTEKNSLKNINWYDQLLTNVRWHRVKYKSSRFQKDCTTPCYTAFYGGRSEYAPYIPIPEWFQPLIDEVNSHLGEHVQFNAFLLRLYFDGNDEIAWHTDGRTFLGEEPTIASLSLGCKATFEMRRMTNVWPCVNGSSSNNNNNGRGATNTSTTNTKGGAAADVDTATPIQSFTLHDGDLLVMRGNTQKHWHHRVPKEKGRGVRLNINFRYVLPGQDAERGQGTYYKYMVFGDVPIDQEPPSWTYDEIVSKKGGMMNFVQKGVKCHGSKREHRPEQQDQLSTQKREESNNNDSATAASFSRASSDESDTQRYLTSEQSVDKEVFMSLPQDIREELVAQWKSQQNRQQSSANAISPLPPTSSSKRKESGQSVASSFGKKTKKTKKGTIDSFFAKR